MMQIYVCPFTRFSPAAHSINVSPVISASVLKLALIRIVLIVILNPLHVLLIIIVSQMDNAPLQNAHLEGGLSFSLQLPKQQHVLIVAKCQLVKLHISNA